jgi:type VI secretion system protein ImpF
MQEQDFAPSIWDRLMAASETPSHANANTRMPLDQYKASILRDLEDLLNTRVGIPGEWFAGFPACRKSILNFGLTDFADLCLTSDDDRKTICRSLREAIHRFEPRLTNVKAEVHVERGKTNRLDFVISGSLKGYSAERFELNAMLQPSTLRYSISQVAGVGRTGKANSR